ncbi:hypothetical protein G3N55_11305 [Dissulfurirhabdus thermomarina]|uniref:Uncharacterized protein n=1 Tax=Dissulfurirhabdus thermomarina TaxID=1765737 RepID=A0A6N9TQ78_DISTH|nr:hypothetical protein [Dissulfurirhabdus thermomarina]NDY43425.1 hypothetical protein [Dissulfurirhabdus thermomarina]NMX23578.1 hypothetical protein [Dissulfurirhabdus thermomarina]
MYTPDTEPRYALDRLESAIDEAESLAFQIDVIHSFEERGWALYEIGMAAPLASFLELKPVVEAGRAWYGLNFRSRYIPLPLVPDDTNWPKVRDLAFALVSQGRGPYFVDLEETDDGRIQPVGVYLVDSVILDPPLLRLVIDRNLSRIKDPARIPDFEGEAGLEVPIHLADLWKIRRQLMLACRGRPPGGGRYLAPAAS